jgi:hypothetical protein
VLPAKKIPTRSARVGPTKVGAFPVAALEVPASNEAVVFIPLDARGRAHTCDGALRAFTKLDGLPVPSLSIWFDAPSSCADCLCTARGFRGGGRGTLAMVGGGEEEVREWSRR